MGRRGAAFLVSLLIAAASAGAAIACSCVRYESAEEQFGKAEIAFVGTVEDETFSEASYLASTRFSVVKTLKGPAVATRTIVHSRDDGGNCGINYQPGQTVLVFAYEHRGALTTSSCSAPQFPLADFERLAAPK